MNKSLLLLGGSFLFFFNFWSQTTITLNPGTELSTDFRNPFAADWAKIRYDFLITKAELEAEGASGGVISSVGFNLINNCGSGSCGNNFYFNNITLNNFTIKLKNTSSTTLSEFESGGTVVYEGNVTRAFLSQNYNTVYWVDFVFNENGGVFDWNGTDNLLVEICYERSGDPTFAGQVYVSTQTDRVRRQKNNSADPACGLTTSGNNDNRRIHIRFNFDSFLPIELNNFNASCSNGNVELDWSTLSEENNYYFTVEKSVDGFTWEVLDSIMGAGSSVQELFYSLIDESPYSGLSYYRLKQTDYDGRYKYFSPVSVICDHVQVEVSPNPSDGLFTVKGVNRLMRYEVYDAVGKIVFKGSIDAGEFNIDLTHLSSASYLLRIVDENQSFNFKLLKL